MKNVGKWVLGAGAVGVGLLYAKSKGLVTFPAPVQNLLNAASNGAAQTFGSLTTSSAAQEVGISLL